MKRFFAAWALGCALVACNNNASDTTTTDSTTTITTDSTTTMMTPAPATDTAGSMNSTAMHEGMMTMREGKVVEMKNGQWVAIDKTVTCTDGCKVMPNGDVVMKDGMKMKLKEGESIDKDGNMMDKSGKMMDDMMDKAGHKMDNMMDSANSKMDRATDKMHDKMHKAGAGMDSMKADMKH